MHSDRGRQNRLKCGMMIICKMHQKEKEAPNKRWTEPGASDSAGSQAVTDTKKASRDPFPPSLRQHVGLLAQQWHAEGVPVKGSEPMFKAIGLFVASLHLDSVEGSLSRPSRRRRVERGTSGMPEAGRAGTLKAHEKPDFGGPQRTKGGVSGCIGGKTWFSKSAMGT